MLDIRLPRVVLAGIVGFALGISGAALQGLFRNPLADPSLIGIASGAGLSVAIVVVIFGSSTSLLGMYSTNLAAFVGGAVTCFAIYYFSQLTGSLSVAYMLLAGIAINAIAEAGTALLSYYSNDQQLRLLTMWRMGNLGGANWTVNLVALSIILPTVVYLWHFANQLNILMLGEAEARSLGVNSQKIKLAIILGTAMAVATAVAFSGIIGFVGLIVPHFMRIMISADHRILFPASAIFGAILLMVADLFSRVLISPAELPVGILTSLIGGPFFMWLLYKQYATSK